MQMEDDLGVIFDLNHHKLLYQTPKKINIFNSHSLSPSADPVTARFIYFYITPYTNT